MRWPLRNQILLPFLAIQVVTVLTVALSSAWNAVQQVDQELEGRLESVLATLESASYPLTAGVLDQLHRLSGADFVVVDHEGRLVNATIAVTQIDEREFAAATHAVDRNSIDKGAVVTLGGEPYLVGMVRRRTGNTERRIVALYPERRWELARWQAVLPPLSIGGALLCLTLLASVWVSRRIARRIQNVQQHVLRIAGGDFTPVPTTTISDELRDLSQGVNRMAAVVDQSMRRIRDNERTSILNQLVGGLAHQLRNSLTGARTSIQLHRRHCQQSGDEAIDVAIQQLTLTEEQIKALLRLSKGESPAPKPARLTAILDEVVSLVRPLCRHQKIDFAYHRGDGDCEICDADAMRGALLNLTINAIEATGPGGHVTIETHKIETHNEAGDIAVDISDDGPGVPVPLRENVFMPFFTTKPEGAGLGLALARQAAEDCGGSLLLEQTEEQTVFRLRFPGSASDTFASDNCADENSANDPAGRVGPPERQPA